VTPVRVTAARRVGLPLANLQGITTEEVTSAIRRLRASLCRLISKSFDTLVSLRKLVFLQSDKGAPRIGPALGRWSYRAAERHVDSGESVGRAMVCLGNGLSFAARPGSLAGRYEGREPALLAALSR
jgi:hypothetical protein